MKTMTAFWCGTAGLGLFMLLGQMFAAYPDLRGGALRLIGVVVIGLMIAAAFDALMLRKRNPAHTRTDLVYSLLPSVGVGLLLLLLLVLGGA